MKSHGESINDVLRLSVLGAGITMSTKLLTAKLTKSLKGGGEGLFRGEVVTKFSPVNMEEKTCGTA
jgi:hypothetical protein